MKTKFFKLASPKNVVKVRCCLFHPAFDSHEAAVRPVSGPQQTADLESVNSALWASGPRSIPPRFVSCCATCSELCDQNHILFLHKTQKSIDLGAFVGSGNLLEENTFTVRESGFCLPMEE